jgi:hypothetical protein
VVVHLLRELAGELHGLHVRPERTSAEDTLDEGFDPGLDAAKDVHRVREGDCAPAAL